MDWFKIDNVTYFVMCGINILNLSFTLTKLVKSNKYKEGMKIIVMLILSNIALIIYIYCYVKLYAPDVPPNNRALLWTSCTSFFLFNAL